MKYKRERGSMKQAAYYIVLLSLGFSGCATTSDADYADRNNLDSARSRCVQLARTMKRLYWLLAIVALFGCARVLAVREIPEINLGEANFFRTIEAHTDAPIVSGNRIEILLNGDETFPMCLSIRVGISITVNSSILAALLKTLRNITGQSVRAHC